MKLKKHDELKHPSQIPNDYSVNSWLKHNLIAYLKPCTDSPLTAMSSRAVPEGRRAFPQ